MLEKAYTLIGRHGKGWLANRLGITRVTLNTRLDKNNWKKGEMQILNSI